MLIGVVLLLIFSYLDSKWRHIKEFEEYKESFDSVVSEIKQLKSSNILDTVKSSDEFKLFISYKDNNADKIVCYDGINGEYIDLPFNQIQLFDRLNDYFLHKVELVWIYNDGRISIGGDFRKMIVYSESDIKPDFYFYPNDGVSFRTYKLDSNWYLLLLK